MTWMIKKAARKTSEETPTELPPEKKSDTVEFRIPKPPFMASSTPFLVILLMVVSFLLGALFTKVQYLEKAGSLDTNKETAASTPQPTTVSNALIAYAKKLGMNQNQFKQCLTSGKYKDKVNKDTALGSSLGVRGTPGFFINGVFLGGAYPFEQFKEIIDKQLEGTASTNYLDYSEVLQRSYEDPNGKGFDPVPKTIEIGNAPIRGNKNAPVTIIEFSDFQCPFCSRSVPIVEQVLKTYGDKVKLVYKQLPLTSIHPNAQIASLASECANEQKKFWEYHDLLFTNQTAWSSLPQEAVPTLATQ